jgi:hypothetical protein
MSSKPITNSIHDNSGIAAKIAEGKSANSIKVHHDRVRSQFSRMVVIDVISDPSIVNSKRVEYWRNVLGVENIQFAYDLPRNTIIAKTIQDAESSPIFVFPFFPSHLSLPCKPGETVWIMNDWMISEISSISFVGQSFWFGKAVDIGHTDDVNHSHLPRAQDDSQVQSSKQIAEGKQILYELTNGKTDANNNVQNGSTYIVDSKINETWGVKEVFENLVTQTDASKLIQYEPIPRFRKRPADVCLEGSNNTLIVLGTDRTSAISEYSPSDDVQNRIPGDFIPSIPKSDTSGEAGSIDIVVGRGQTKKTLGEIVSTTSTIKKSGSEKGKEIHKEILKQKENLNKNEGDLDYKNDRSRLLVSQRTNTDKNFELDAYNSEFSVKDSSSGDSSVVAKSDKIRLIGRSDIELISTGFTGFKSQDKAEIKAENVDNTKWSSIMLKDSGDVVISNAKDKVFSVGPHKDAVDPSKALLTLDSGKKRVIVPLADSGVATIGSTSTAGALGVFDNGAKTVSIGGGDPTALMYADVNQKMLTIGTALGAFNAATGAVSLAGGAIVAGGGGGGGVGGGVPVSADASPVAHARETSDALNQIVQCLTQINIFLAKFGTALTPPDLIACAALAATAASTITPLLSVISTDASNLASKTKIQ